MYQFGARTDSHAFARRHRVSNGRVQRCTAERQGGRLDRSGSSREKPFDGVCDLLGLLDVQAVAGIVEHLEADVTR